MILEPWIFVFACRCAVLSHVFGVAWCLRSSQTLKSSSCARWRSISTSNEVWFSLGGEVNCAEKPVLECTESSIYSRTQCSWRKSWCWVCEVCTQRNCETATGVRCVRNILRPVQSVRISQVLQYFVRHMYVANHSEEAFDGCIIFRGLWPRVPVIQQLVTFI